MHILFISEYYPPAIMGGGEINLQTLINSLTNSTTNTPPNPTNTQNIHISLLTSSSPNLPKIEIHPNLTIYRHLTTGSSPSSLLGNLSRLLFLKHSILKQTKKIIQQQNHPIDIIHFIGGTIIAAKQLKAHLKKKTPSSKQSIPLFATIESYPTLCPKADRWYKQQKPCAVKCTLPKFLSCQCHCTEIGKMKNSWYLKYNPLFFLLTYYYYHQRNQALNYCNLIAISKYVQNLLQQQGHQSIVIPNILDTKPFEIAKKIPQNKSNPSPLRLLYLGSLIESKGPHIILQSLKDINPTLYHLNLYGNGILKPQLQQYITKHHLNATIHPHAPYEQIPQLYQNADIILFPSIWPEPFGRIPIEAHAADKIVIASNIGAIPETVNKNDIIIPPNDPQALKNAIMELLDNKSFKQTKEQKVESKYHLKTITTHLQQIYRNSINKQNTT